MITKYTTYIKENNHFLTSKEEIKNWLDSMKIKKYIIKDDLTVDVDDFISISYKNLTKIPVKFNKVNGYFSCSENNLISLKGCPSIVNGFFDCSTNNLISLKDCSTTINGSFFCSHNKLTNLKGCPSIVNGSFFCYENPYLIDINDLDSKMLIKNIDNIKVSQEIFDKYFEYWITKDSNILSVLKDKVSNNIKQKYRHIFQANNFDLI